MGFKKLKFYNFRNLKNQIIDIDSNNIILIGENAQGKTNFLEALYLLSYGSSFRLKRENDFIFFGEKECSIKVKIEKECFCNDIQFKIQDNKVSILIDNKKIIDRKELFEFFPLVVFKHEDIYLITGTPEIKRNFFDQVITLCNIEYLDYFRKYKKILKQRNFLLKEGKPEYLDILDYQLFDAGMKIVNERKIIIDDFNRTFNKNFEFILNEKSNLRIDYLPSWKNITFEEFKKNKKQDFFYKTTTTGPHRDQYIIKNGDFDFSKIASTGQKRILSLLLKINKSVLISEKTKKKCIFLFDDVLLELDKKKKKRILEILPSYEQAFFTFLPEENFEEYDFFDKQIFIVKAGELKEIKND